MNPDKSEFCKLEDALSDLHFNLYNLERVVEETWVTITHEITPEVELTEDQYPNRITKAYANVRNANETIDSISKKAKQIQKLF